MRVSLPSAVSFIFFQIIILTVDGSGLQEHQIETANNKTHQCNPCCRGQPGRDGRDGPPGPPTAISHVDYINFKIELIQELKEEFSFDTIGSLAGSNMTQCQGIGLNQEKPASSCIGPSSFAINKMLLRDTTGSRENKMETLSSKESTVICKTSDVESEEDG
jgi:hypothetical protein